jgi:head-tail adaptor
VNKPPLLHPDLLTSLPDFFPSLCTIQSVTITRDGYKGEVETLATLHADVPCVMAPAGVGGREIKRPDMTYVVATHTVVLAAYYADITEKMHAVVDGLTLNILIVAHDSHSKMTRLACEVVR